MGVYIPTFSCGEADPCACSSPCECFCELTLDTAGGESGYDHTFVVTGDFLYDRYIFVDFESYTIKDRLIISADGSGIYDSGCIGAHVTPTVLVPGGTTTARVQVIPHCDSGQSGTTAWVLSIVCASL